MSLLDAYVTVEEYEARATGGRVTDDTALPEELAAASRLFDHEMGLAPGALNDVAATRVFSGQGRSVLSLVDGEGQYLLRTVSADGIAVDTDGDGTADVTFDLSDTWCAGLPRNAAAAGKPYDALELLPHAAALVAVWPAGRWNVSVTGAWGYAAVPQGVKETVVSMTRDLRDHHAAGSGNAPQAADASWPLSQQTWRLIRSLKQQFSYRTGARVLRPERAR